MGTTNQKFEQLLDCYLTPLSKFILVDRFYQYKGQRKKNIKYESFLRKFTTVFIQFQDDLDVFLKIQEINLVCLGIRCKFRDKNIKRLKIDKFMQPVPGV